ncbi:16S rRNA (cytosine(1402)-N(4))-methyltransferase RsmH [Geminocystis sp. GBBB08]|uniref:16S rRNA (cytosine(1402)-N(4))-methyltransferase RsmH n=1 Tax=Geminocystis sp. GBBB08 TaxID=2604140 RepID=UPI0027E332C0|nr:16S rRNA (cytosine(1402)-N(4))-methyltransferase RsmH [Geminocystis sp. GBBB08]MBL1209898.1 16S rRNA (cytosine(1402)-N(4))-methyltransferase RsmH [Geminocystis sp. GBBB08]
MSEKQLDFFHQSVLPQEIIEYLNIVNNGHYLDATLGGGGHTNLILSHNNTVKVTAIDRDIQAINFVQENLKDYGDRLDFWQGNFADYQPLNIRFDGIIADLGVSSPQLDQGERGFSFRHDGNLDMRMDTSQSLMAKDIVNRWPEKPLADLIYLYGEERLSRRIAKTIIEKRPFSTTLELAEAIASCVPNKYRHGKIHPATRTFQALRIKVNEELKSLEKFLQIAPTWLKPEGRIGVISFHSLEDRIVKNQFRDNSSLKIITKKPIIPSIEEQRSNPRSRSAKLRVIQLCGLNIF